MRQSAVSRYAGWAFHFVSGIMQRTLQATPRLPLYLILVSFSALTVYQSMTLPIGEADDETDHYQYLRFVARTWHPPFTETERNEAGFKGGLAPLYYWLTAWPITVIGEDSTPDIRRVDARPERHIPTDGLGINHVLHTLDEQWPWQGHPLAWHIIRLFSLPMGWVTIIATYALARRLVAESTIVPIIAAAFVAFLPRFVISSAVINDDNLVFALATLLLLVQVIILQSSPPHAPKITAILGLLFGLALLTKYFSLILVPEVMLTLLLANRKIAGPRIAGARVVHRTAYHLPRSLHHTRPGRPRDAPQTTPSPAALPLVPFFAALLLTAGPWFTFISLRFNRISELGVIPGLAASLGEPQVTEGLIGLLSGQAVRPVAATYTLVEWLSLLYQSFWFEYGWMQIFAPAWIYTGFTIFTLLILLGLIEKFRVYYGQNISADDIPAAAPISQKIETARQILGNIAPTTWLLALHVLLFTIVLVGRYWLSATIDTGQGRHLYPALPVIALLVALGLVHTPAWISRLIQKIPYFSNQSWIFRFTPIALYGVMVTAFLLPAAASLLPPFTIDNSLFTLHHTSLITHRYPIAPVSAVPFLLAPEQQQSLEFDSRLWLVGLDATSTVTAGNALPVTLYWHAEREAQRDYLYSLCLQNEDQSRPAACWRGQFADGRYPARTWEQGDTIADTVFIPIPTCSQLRTKSYVLNLQIWPLEPTSPTPLLSEAAVFQHIFSEPVIDIVPSTTAAPSRPVELWLGGQRLNEAANVNLGQSLIQINYAGSSSKPSPAFRMTTDAEKRWLPQNQLDTPLYLPCSNKPDPTASQSHFIASPSQISGVFESNPLLPNVNLSLRSRLFGPITSTISFSHTLSALSIQLPNYSSNSSYQLPLSTLPITVRWQARRWMHEPLVVALKLLDKDFFVGAERTASLGERYPNVLWAPTEIVEESYPLRFEPGTPPGLYLLELSLIRQDEVLPNGFEYQSLLDGAAVIGNNLSLDTIRLLDPLNRMPPPQSLDARFGPSIQLRGYALSPASALNDSGHDKQSPVSLTLYWQSGAKIETDYTVFTQLIGPDGQAWAQWDNPPQAGRYPTTAWAENDTVIDRYILSLREEAPSGPYRLVVGMYDPTTGQRLQPTINGQIQADNAVELRSFLIIP